MDLIDFIKFNDMPEDFQDLWGIIGEGNSKKLLKDFQGQTFHVPILRIRNDILKKFAKVYPECFCHEMRKLGMHEHKINKILKGIKNE
jgi:hypothetical protein